MKVEVIKNEEQEVTYPCLMESNNGLVVSFTSKQVGYVLVANNSFEFGCLTNLWGDEVFKPFTGKLVLSNE